MGWRPGPRGFCSSSWTGVWTRSAPPSRYNKIYLILARLSSVVDARATISWRPAGRAPPFSPARQRRGRRTIMAEQPTFTPDDFWFMRFVTDMRLSPDGSLLAYAVQSNDRAANETRSAIWLWSAATGQARQLTSGARRDTNPRWSPDGHLLAFESDRAGGKTQVWVVPVDGGEARQVSHLRRGASDPVGTADGAALIVRGEVRPEENPLQSLSDEPVERTRREKDEADRPRIVTRLQYRWDGKGYFEGRTQLFRIPLNGGAVEQLTGGDFDHGDAACPPAGRARAFVSDRDGDRDPNITTDVWPRD